MARYYLHFFNEDGELHDGEGFVAPDKVAACDIGLRAAGEIIAAEIANRLCDVTFTLRLDDENGRRLATIPVRASVPIHLTA
ncbi:DUF6894 family protein [Sphingomonas zeicaulis]|uniref:DUF6894 family protein n=1 Tax=Sphingomonas zeicaulis TaxID=1632740 RepID=UPI003D196E2F